MKKSLLKRVIRRNMIRLMALAVSIIFVTSITGCQEEAQQDPRKFQLIAAENIQVKDQLQQCQTQLEEQTRLAEKYLKEHEDFKKRSGEATEKLMKYIYDSTGAEKKQLQQENAELKSKIEELSREIEELKGEPNAPNKP